MTFGAPLVEGSPSLFMGYALAFWLGASIGSFLNVVIYRLPREESVVRPRSRCPRCGKMIRWYDNIPVASWLWLRGRCRACRGRISPRYPLVEAAMGALAAGLWARWPQLPLWAAAAGVCSAFLLAIALIDWDTFLIPDELSLGLLAAGLAASPLNPYFTRGHWWRPPLSSLEGAAVGFLVCLAVAELGERLFGKEAMGGGDVKLLAAVGAWTGGVGAFDCLMVASLLGSVYGIGLMLRGKARRSDPIPFGPFLSAAAVFNLFLLLPLGFPFVPVR